MVKHLCATRVISRDPAARQRVVFEKPFGQDLTSARALDASLQAHLEESQIYRIDHYLGKEGWRIVEPVLKAWAASPAESFPNYAAGTWGPDASDELLAAAGHAWRNLV